MPMDEMFENPAALINSPAPVAPEPTAPAEPAPAPVVSAALAKFHSCRWRKPAEDGIVEHCTHRDVLPMAGTTGFNADSWCPDCSFYKLRRTPRKREY